MRNLNLEVPENLQIEINNHVFNVNKSDIDILNKCAEFQGKYADLQKSDIAGIIDAANSFISYIDEILGEGAVLKISGGKPVGVSCAVEWLIAICGEITRITDDYISRKYE